MPRYRSIFENIYIYFVYKLFYGRKDADLQKVNKTLL